MYTINRFGSLSLSLFNNNYTLSPVPVKTRLVSTLGGVFDNDGTARSAQQYPFGLSYDCVVAETVYNDNRATLDALRAAVGTRARLYRTAENDATIQHCTARLVDMPHDRPYRMRGYFEIGLKFLQLTPWNGSDHAAWRFDDGYEFDDALEFDPDAYTITFASGQTQTVVNGGNLPVTDVILTVKTDANPLTNIAWYVPYTIDLAWRSTVPANSTLIIDCGAKSVTLNGVNRYANLSFGAAHILEEWFVLQPGNNTVQIAATGTKTGATWGVQFKDWWA